MSEPTWIKLPRPVLGVDPALPTAWEVSISFDHPRHPGCYGYFEHDTAGEGGGLWFERVEVPGHPHKGVKWALTDYDGRAVLPLGVYEALRADPRFEVDADFDPRREI
jgi:hypothetical protein